MVMTVKNPEVKVGVDVVLSFQNPLILSNGSVVIMEDIHVAQFGQLVAEYQLWFRHCKDGLSHLKKEAA